MTIKRFRTWPRKYVIHTCDLSTRHTRERPFVRHLIHVEKNRTKFKLGRIQTRRYIQRAVSLFSQRTKQGLIKASVKQPQTLTMNGSNINSCAKIERPLWKQRQILTLMFLFILFLEYIVNNIYLGNCTPDTQFEILDRILAYREIRPWCRFYLRTDWTHSKWCGCV